MDADVGSLNGRALVWKYSFNSVADSGLAHMLIGSGYNSAQFLLPPAMEPGSWNYHNEYLNNLMDGGIIGLAIFIAFLISIWVRVRSTTHPLQNVMRGWIVFLFIAGLSGVVSGMHIFWLLLGAIWGGTGAQLFPSQLPGKTILPIRIYRGWKKAIYQSVEDGLREHGFPPVMPDRSRS
jgi:O-antigen ligase